MDEREGLTTVVRTQAAEMAPWQDAELHLLHQALRERLDDLGVRCDADVALALMATATLLAPSTPEWGGDVRCTLGEIALLGLRLLDDGEGDATPA